jgi:C-terminal processing protease CtpA/Prc
MRQLGLVALLLLLAGAPRAHAQQRLTKQQEKNLVAFAHLYGYVQYFHPSDEAQQVAWRMFSLKGSKQMLAAKNDKELIQSLNSLFLPLGPTIRIFPTSQRQQFDPATVQPPATVLAPKVVSWQHQGLNTESLNYGKGFQKVRLNRPATENNTFTTAKDIDISRFSGQPYEVAITLSAQAGSPDFAFELACAQLLGGSYIPSAAQHLARQKLTQQARTYTFTGTFATSARTLDANLVFPAALMNGAIKFNTIKVEIFVVIAGQRVRLPTATAKADWATKQQIELTISSDELLPEPLFAEQLHLDDHLSKEIAPGISCIVPLALAGDAAHTYPVGDSLRLRQLHVQLADYTKYPAEWSQYERPDQLTLPEVRVSNIVNAWNCLRHGYAYWSSASASPDALLHRALRLAYQDSTYVGFDHTLRVMMAPLNDGHGFVSPGKQLPSRDVLLLLGKVENQVVVTRALTADLAAQVQPGDIVLRIDGVPARKVLRERASLESGSPQNKEARALLQLLSGPAAQPLDLKLRRGRTTRHLCLPRTFIPESSRTGSLVTAQRPDQWLAPGIYYVDWATMYKPVNLQASYDTLAQAKAIIFDIRGYPGAGIRDLIGMLLPAPAKVSLFYSLHMLRPDQEDLRLVPDVDQYAPTARHLSSKIFFLTDANTQSAPESFLALIRAFKLGTLVGRPTSGANGNINNYVMQGGFSISYSGLYVLNADGSRHHAIGILPDVLVEPTLESVRKGQDLILETALKLAKEGW